MTRKKQNVDTTLKCPTDKEYLVKKTFSDQHKLVKLLSENVGCKKSQSSIQKIRDAKYVRILAYKDHTVVVYVSKSNNLHVGTSRRKYMDKKHRDVGIILACLRATGKKKRINLVISDDNLHSFTFTGK